MMKKVVSKYFVLFILTLVFVAPGIAALIFYQHPQWLGPSHINKGEMIQPPFKIKQLAHNKHWNLILYTNQDLNNSFKNTMELVAKIRLALGRKLYLVDQWVLNKQVAPVYSLEMQSLVSALQYHVLNLNDNVLPKNFELFTNSQIFIADPQGYLILRYPITGNPDNVYKDLKLLLNTTEKS